MAEGLTSVSLAPLRMAEPIPGACQLRGMDVSICSTGHLAIKLLSFPPCPSCPGLLLGPERTARETVIPSCLGGSRCLRAHLTPFSPWVSARGGLTRLQKDYNQGNVTAELSSCVDKTL